MHGSTMIYLFVTPGALALGMYLVPLQVGAAEIAWPRLNLMGFWLLVLGGLVMWSGFLTRNGAGVGGVDGRVPAVGGDQHAGPRHGPVVRRASRSPRWPASRWPPASWPPSPGAARPG